jgi:serine/threonine-protein kinase
MPPEQVRGELAIGPRADVYSLGVVLYECVTGRRPFEASSLPELGVRIHQGRYTPASELVPGLPPQLDAVIARALASDPEARPDARGFAEELGALRTQPLDEPEPPVAVPARRSRPATLILLVAAGMGTGVVAAAWATRRDPPAEPAPPRPLAAPASVATQTALPLAPDAGAPVIPEPVRQPAPARAARPAAASSAAPTRAQEHKLDERNPF